MKTYLSLTQLNSALSLRDLSDPGAGPHAMQLMLADVVSALEQLWGVPSRTHRLNPLVATTTTGWDTRPTTSPGTPAIPAT
jgi:phenylalanyl-tRNA synthetase alpha chain